MRRKTRQVLVRNLDDEVIAAIKLKAELNGHSLEQELREIIKRAVPLTPDERVALSRKIRGMQSRPATLDSTDLIREARDNR
jgi:plasmid stability protein